MDIKDASFEVYANLNEPIEDDTRRSDILSHKGQFYKVLSVTAPIKNYDPEGFSIVQVIKKSIDDRRAQILEMIEK